MGYSKERWPKHLPPRPFTKTVHTRLCSQSLNSSSNPCGRCGYSHCHFAHKETELRAGEQCAPGVGPGYGSRCEGFPHFALPGPR